jgi:hypothetical protein
VKEGEVPGSGCRLSTAWVEGMVLSNRCVMFQYGYDVFHDQDNRYMSRYRYDVFYGDDSRYVI